MRFDARHQRRNVLLLDRRVEARGQRFAGQFGRADEEIESERGEWHGDAHDRRRPSRPRTAGAGVVTRLVAGPDQAAGDLGTRRLRLALGDDATVDVAIHLAELIAIDRQCLGALRPAVTRRPVERHQHR